MILLRNPPVAGARPSGQALLVGAHQRQRQLAGEQLVIGKPRPGRAFRARRCRLVRLMQRRRALAKAGQSRCRSQAVVLPFGQCRHPADAASPTLRTTLRLKPSVSG